MSAPRASRNERCGSNETLSEPGARRCSACHSTRLALLPVSRTAVVVVRQRAGPQPCYINNLGYNASTRRHVARYLKSRPCTPASIPRAVGGVPRPVQFTSLSNISNVLRRSTCPSAHPAFT